MKINGVEIIDTYAEAWALEVVRFVITAVNEEMAMASANQFVGAAGSGELGSVINGGIERVALPTETPDGRVGVVVALTQIPASRKAFLDELALRFHLATLVATSAIFDFMVEGVEIEKVSIADHLFGHLTREGATELDLENADKLQSDSWEEEINGRMMFVLPTLTGTYKFEKEISIATGGCDGHFVCYCKDSNASVLAVSAAKAAVKSVDGVCPMGIGLEQVYREKDYVPSLREKIENTKVPEDTGSILNLLVFGVAPEKMGKALGVAIKAACQIPGVVHIGAMNFGGEFGPYKFVLHEIVK